MIPIAKPIMGEEEKKAVLEVLNSGMLAQGKPDILKYSERIKKRCALKDHPEFFPYLVKFAFCKLCYIFSLYKNFSGIWLM